MAGPVYNLNDWRKQDDARMAQMPIGMANSKPGALMNADTSAPAPAQPIINRAKQAVGEGIYNLRTSAGADEGQPQGAIPTPDADQALRDKASQLQSDVQGALAPKDAAHNPVESGPAPVDPNSQAGGAEAQAKQQQEMDQTKQKVADDATKGGGANSPITIQDPAQALATRNQNIQAGVGHATTGINQPPVPKPLTETQQKNVALNDAGQDSFKSMNTIGDWFQSRSFLMGMMQTGLSLLDGKGYAESFAAGSKYFDDHYGMEQRSAWADDLLKKGYDRQEIQQYVETGNAKVLTSPEQKAMAQLQAQTEQQQAQANLTRTQLGNEQAAYEQSPEQRAIARQDQEITNAYKQNQMQYQNYQMQQAQANAPLERQLKEAELARTQAQTAAATQKTEGMAGQTGGVNVWTNPQTGLRTSIGGAPLLPGKNVYPVVNSKGVYQQQKGFYQAIDTDTGLPVSVPANMQMYERVATSADNTIQAVNNFQVEGVKLAGPTGEISRDFIDEFGARNKADQTSILQQLEGYQHNLALAQASLEVGGGRPTNADVEAAAASFPRYLDKDGEPIKVSKERMAAMFQNTLRQAAQIHNTANNVATGNYQANMPENYNPQSQVARGTRRFDPKTNKWYKATQSGAMGDRIWAVDTDQSGQ